MKTQLKRLDQQVMVVTGASSGIGQATALAAARQGAKVVLVSRDGDALEALAARIADAGGTAICVKADVGDRASHARIVEAAVARFGHLDTWVNNAGVSIFGTLAQTPLDDQRQLFETNFWGVVYGSLAAVAYFKQHGGGALINLGSEVSDMAVPLQGVYSASKHAVKGYTDALRLELEQERLPISVTLIKPASIATSFTLNARNYMDVEPRLPAPLYSPEAVANAILYAAEHPQRDIYVGAASKAMSALNRRAPGLADKLFGGLMWRQQRSDKRATASSNALYESRGVGGGQPEESRYVHRRSLYTEMATHGRPAAWGASALLLAALAYRLRKAPR
jgi:short-subunit dehydrogenase